METPDFYHHLCSSNPTQEQQFTPEKSKSSVADHFIIEDLLDFSHEDDPIPTDPTTTTTTTNFDSTDSSNLSSFSGVSDPLPTFPDSHISTELCVPYDDIAELEWLSNFVEDSFSSDDLQKLQLISGRQPKPDPLTETVRNNPIFRPDMMQVPGKARSKRNRQAPCNWSSRLLVLSPTSSSSESDNPSNLSASNLSNHSVGKKAPKKKELAENSDGRKCLHCQTDKTPQWRTGPMGPKTLCNACGVRYKSGRLVPEYRPAASPTFVLAKHSNSHRKVLELRRQKEMQMSQHQQFLYPHALFDVSGAGGGGPGGCDEYLIHHQTGPDYRQLI